MGSFSGLGIGLSIVFGCILLVLVGELYYLWWKKRITRREIKDHFTNYAKELFYLFRWKKNPCSVKNSNTQELNTSDVNCHEPDLELGSGKDILLKGFGEEGVESELMRLHNLCGPPRFLFTIKEETKEDLESDDGKSRKASRTRSLSDLIVAVETPFLTPLSSPPLKTQPLETYSQHGFNPLFESSTDAELNRLRSSPPPKFKFLRNAEEKLMRRLMEEAEKRALKNGGSIQDAVVNAPHCSTMATEEKDGSVFTFIIGKNKEREPHLQLTQYHSNASQVLPLASSPSTFRPLDSNKPIVQ